MALRSSIVRGAVLAVVVCLLAVPKAETQPGRMYNTAKQKLLNGGQVIGGTVSTSDPNIYCAMAHAGFDFLWIEMQHSPLTYSEVARMIWACKDAPAIPVIRVPDATEGDIQKATDIGALGIIVPMVATVEEAEAAVRYAKYPPEGRRSRRSGSGAAAAADRRGDAARAAAPSRGRGRLFKTAGLLLLHANSCSSTTEDRSVDGATRHARSRRPGRVAGALVPVGEAAGRAQSRGRCLKCTPQKSTVSKGTNE